MKCPTCNNEIVRHEHFPEQDEMCMECREEFIAIPHVAQVVDMMNRAAKKKAKAYLKFTCLHCGSRQTINKPNSIYTSGSCEECKGVSDFRSPSAQLGILLQAGTPVQLIDDIILGEF